MASPVAACPRGPRGCEPNGSKGSAAATTPPGPPPMISRRPPEGKVKGDWGGEGSHIASCSSFFVPTGGGSPQGRFSTQAGKGYLPVGAVIGGGVRGMDPWPKKVPGERSPLPAGVGGKAAGRGARCSPSSPFAGWPAVDSGSLWLSTGSGVLCQRDDTGAKHPLRAWK